MQLQLAERDERALRILDQEIASGGHEFEVWVTDGEVIDTLEAVMRYLDRGSETSPDIMYLFAALSRLRES